MLLTTSIFLDLLFLLVSILLSLYVFLTRNFNHWKNRGISYKKPLPLVGNFLEVVLVKKNVAEVLSELYFGTNEPYTGIFFLDKPILLVKDLELTRHIIIRDFNNFTDMAIAEGWKGGVNSYLLPCMKGNEWKTFKKIVSPGFNRFNVKNTYFQIIKDAGDELVEYLDKTIENEGFVNCKFVSEIYSAEVSIRNSLGVKAHSFRNKDNKYYRIMRHMFGTVNLRRDLSTTAYMLYPELVNMFKINFVDPYCEKLFREEFFNTVKSRDHRSEDKDYVDILMKLKKDGLFEGENSNIADDKMVAQSIIFSLGAHESTMGSISITLQALAANPDIQTKLRNEINHFIKQGKDETIKFDTIFSEMGYLDMVVKESLRQFPLIPILGRVCTEEYTVPSTNYIIEKGTTLFIPIYAMHNDPRYFPKPEIFDPERFSPKNIGNVRPGTYMPFGDGPRNCVGEKFAVLSIKMGLTRIIQNYEVQLRDENQRELKIDPRAYILSPEQDKVILKFKKIIRS